QAGAKSLSRRQWRPLTERRDRRQKLLVRDFETLSRIRNPHDPQRFGAWICSRNSPFSGMSSLGPASPGIVDADGLAVYPQGMGASRRRFLAASVGAVAAPTFGRAQSRVSDLAIGQMLMLGFEGDTADAPGARR